MEDREFACSIRHVDPRGTGRIRSTVVGPVAPPHRTSDTVATVFFRVGRWGWCRYAARNIRTIITDDRSALELLNINTRRLRTAKLRPC